MSSNMHLILIQSPEFMYQFQCKAENQSFVFCKHRYRLPKTQIGTSLLVKWLIFYIPRAGGPSWIPRQGTRSCVPELRAGTAKQILKIGRERDKSISITLVFKKKIPYKFSVLSYPLFNTVTGLPFFSQIPTCSELSYSSITLLPRSLVKELDPTMLQLRVCIPNKE